MPKHSLTLDEKAAGAIKSVPREKNGTRFDIACAQCAGYVALRSHEDFSVNAKNLSVSATFNALRLESAGSSLLMLNASVIQRPTFTAHGSRKTQFSGALNIQ
ncbi:hypothetical protein [Pseudomonas sp. R37(2017)]|uniref:hypothetical protein n=1 Tax=Pseudomonas sp. R37(2017) TaxID=1981685 RepID=UPI00117AC434|nr:hypothetical protein [Pseudomonas sp. R37(2017)]